MGPFAGTLTRALMCVASAPLGAAAHAEFVQPADAVVDADPAAQAPQSDEVSLSFPGMTGPLTLDPTPITLETGRRGKLYVTGAVSGLALRQGHPFAGDRRTRLDFSNAQLFVQKADGLLQFAVQAGAYSLPSLGTPYVTARKTTRSTFGIIPQAFVKLVPSDRFNVMAGKLPTLAGAEYTFTFQNMNIHRGLLWNQENAVNRGVQANFSKGPLSVSLSLNDGFYSKKYNWLSGLVAFAASPRDVISVVAMGNVGTTRKASFATPLLQNNGEIYNLIWTHSAGAWVITPYLQYTRVPRNSRVSIDRSASTWGGALLSRYTMTPKLSVAGRLEYLASSGNAARGTPNLLYGPGSKAWSVTLTPTFMSDRFFVRGEVGLVRAFDVGDGLGFGRASDKRSQAKFAVESGVIF